MRPRKKKNTDIRMKKCSEIWILQPETYKGRWKEYFGNNNPVHIEIGCGKGGFIAALAKQNPYINYVAIEREKEIIVMAMEKATELGLSNLKFILGDAGNLMDIFDEGEVERIYLNFSDPWHKNRHYKRRLTYRDYLTIYRNILNDNGQIQFKTDNKPLFEFSLNEFAYSRYYMSEITFDLHNSKYNEGNIMTEYESNFASQGMPIYRVCADIKHIDDKE